MTNYQAAINRSGQVRPIVRNIPPNRRLGSLQGLSYAGRFRCLPVHDDSIPRNIPPCVSFFRICFVSHPFLKIGRQTYAIRCSPRLSSCTQPSCCPCSTSCGSCRGRAMPTFSMHRRWSLRVRTAQHSSTPSGPDCASRLGHSRRATSSASND